MLKNLNKNGKRVFSGIQPSGNLHIGNYLGAVSRWAPLQTEYDCMYCVVDLHTLTIYQKPEILRKKILETATILLASGINPGKGIVFVQSHVKEHTELAWILNTITPISELERMTQFKDKANKHRENINAGLLDYPVLMAADILLYHTEAVPVGEDQRQHVEIARTIARRFNNLYGATFKEPHEIIKKESARIMNLSNPEVKMSKSDKDAFGCIGLLDSPSEIREKIKRAVTDSGKEISYDLKNKKGISNLLTIYSLFAEKPVKKLEQEYQNKGYVEFKKDLAEVVIDSLAPFQKKFKELEKDKSYIIKVLADGAAKARLMAEKTMIEVKKKVGLI